MKKRHLKLISLLLVAVMTVCAIPMTVSATDGITPSLEGAAQAPDEQIYTDTLDYDNPDISRPITEIESRREENVKHFLLPDGTVEAVVYGSAVHRRSSLGEWADIDNTLSGDNERLPDLYVTDDLRVAFAKSFLAGGQLFALNENGYGITMKLIPEPISTQPMQPIPEIAAPADTVSTTTVTNAPPRDAQAQWSTVDEALAINNASSIIYTNVRSNTDLEYVLEGNNVKENIIVNAASDSYEYSFELGLSGLVPTLREDGSIALSDTESGETEYVIPAPYMYDARGELSDGVYYILTEKSDGIYVLKVTADSEWINEDNREFPVTIDPTIEKDIWYDTYIDSSKPTSSYGFMNQLWVSSTQTAFIKTPMPEIPSGSTISVAYLNVAYYHYDDVVSGSLTASAHMVNMSWTENLTWNTANTYSNLGISTSALSHTTFSGSAGASGEAPIWKTFDVTTAVATWYSGAANNGIAIKRYSGSNDSVILKSSNVGYPYIPYFTIIYIEPRVADGVYKIKNVVTGKYIDVTDGNTVDGTQLQQWSGATGDGNRAQLFKIRFTRGVDTLNYYTVRPLTNCGQGISIPATGQIATVEDFPTTGTSAVPLNQSIIITDVGGNYIFKIIESSVTRYLAAPSDGTNGSKLYTIGSQNSNTYWILEPYTTDIDGVEFESSPDNLVLNESYTYKAIMYSSTVGRNGPVQYLVKNADGTDTDKATINQSTGALTTLKPGTVRVGATYTGSNAYWYVTIDIKFEDGLVYTLNNAADNTLIRPQTSAASAEVITVSLDQTNTSLMWKFEDNGDGYFLLKNELRIGDQYNGYYLCAPTSATEGARITVAAYSESGAIETSRVLWRFVRQSDGTFKIQSKNREGSSYYLYASSGYVTQSSANSTSWDIKPLIMNVRVMYDQAFVDRFGTNYREILQSVYGNNSNGISFASFYKDNFGIRVNVKFENTAYASLPYDKNCNHKNDIDTFCLDCKNAANDDVNTECEAGHHHKSQDGFVDNIDQVALKDSTYTQILYTGHNACNVKDDGTHGSTAYGIATRTNNAAVVFTDEFEWKINLKTYDGIIKTSIHEVLHTLGVTHCNNSEQGACVMNSKSSSVIATLPICPVCENTCNENKLWLFNHE